ncbi:alpha-ketoglutarate-dependent dioxygenase alkB homolog 4-like [Schistocerca cancellata]|uniref:alpha-ketoglutarate-dependent dioxygenase alkB homolog 4-like n=1 Tax=Schistocerca cancellata TaxID=274614 RepID=UPI002117EFBD|nr:alpha-ketoglutarate-dependent dioxygenase alkB homolog 4-like [Schistocerca cancellata]
MEKPRPCGCKGIRTCLICEREFGIPKKDFKPPKGCKSYIYCAFCNKAWEGSCMKDYKTHSAHEGDAIEFPGIYIQLDFLTPEEEAILINGIDEMPWDLSQSGRRKQNFGPKCNFKKKRLQLSEFNGFPEFTKFVQERFETVPLLSGYKTIEQCSLEYDPIRGASIDPHIDDCWIWGERIVTVNLLSDSMLTFTKYRGDIKRYNLCCAFEYRPVVLGPLDCCEQEDCVVRVPMPRRSLLVVYGPARYGWEHCVLREDISERRVCIAYREFTPPYLKGGQHEEKGSEILNAANNFWDHRIMSQES